MEIHPAASAVFEAAKTGDTEALQRLIQRDSLILNRLPLLSSFTETPLHVSVLAGHLDFTTQLLYHNPGLAVEVDSSSCLPLHLASAAGHIDIVKALLNANKDACLVPDEDGRIPLHLAAMRGRVDVIRELAIARPESVFVKMPDGDTVLHLCVKFNHLEALKLLVRIINNRGESASSSSLINLGDQDGNTLLHLAAMFKKLQTTSYLLTSVASMREAVNALNKHGLTALQCLDLSPKDFKSMQIQDLLVEAGGHGGAEKLLTPASTTLLPPSQSSTKSRLKSMGKWLKNVLKLDDNWIGEMKEAVLVVATLIASMAFQVANNPPGGVWQENMTTPDRGAGCNATNVCKAGTAVLAYAEPELLNAFIVFNTAAFGGCLGVILLIIGGFPIKNNKFFIWLLTQAVCACLTFIMISFVLAELLITPTNIINQVVFWVLLVLLITWLLLDLVISLLDTLRFLIWIFSKLRKCRRNSGCIGGGGGGGGLV